MLAKDIGISRSYLGDIESGRIYPNYVLLSKIAEACGVLFSFFGNNFVTEEVGINKNKDIYSKKDFFPITKTNKIPVVGVIRAGEPIIAEQNIIGYVELPADLVKDAGEYFGLKVVGDSMNLDRICEGDIAIVKKQDVVENGDIAIVLTDDENATIKRFYMTNTTITLMPHSSNTEHQPRIIDLKKTSVKVLGKVVRAIINF